LNATQPAVSIKGVSKSFKAGVTALTGIDLEVRPKEFISLIGPSGCGKSTLLRIIGDLIEPSEGSVEVNGVRIGARDGAAITDENVLKIKALEDTEIVLVDAA